MKSYEKREREEWKGMGADGKSGREREIRVGVVGEGKSGRGR